MTLFFSQELNGNPTYFAEKIWSGLRDIPVSSEFADYIHSPFRSDENILDFKPKIHTIRTDQSNRWKAGDKIHFVINNRSKNRLQFAPVGLVKSVQTIKIRFIYISPQKTTAHIMIDDYFIGSAYWKNCQLMDCWSGIDQLAINDGFASVNEFFDYFSDDFEGKIIHWTGLKY